MTANPDPTPGGLTKRTAAQRKKYLAHLQKRLEDLSMEIAKEIAEDDEIDEALDE